MNYQILDSSGTDDDMPPSHQNRGSRRGAPYPRHVDMQARIHDLEVEAYIGILRAFQAQADALSWEKEGLLTGLRKELDVSNDKHLELLNKVNGDDIIRGIREWRKSGGNQAPQLIPDFVSNHVDSTPLKKQKTSQLVPGIPPLHSGRHLLAGLAVNRSYMTYGSNEPAERASLNEHIVGTKVWMRWPEDSTFYEAVIAQYNPSKGLHAVIYDKNKPNESFEWVDLNEISPEDLKWDNPFISQRGSNKPPNRGRVMPSAGRGRGSMKGYLIPEFQHSQSVIANKVTDEIKLLNTEALVREVEQIFLLSNPDPREFEKAKNMLDKQEMALLQALQRLADVSDGESDGSEQPF